MKYKIGVVVMLLVGGFIGFYGVLLSVFGDATPTERNQFIAVVLAVYFVVGAITGYLLPGYSWKWGLILGAPGALILLLFLIQGLEPFILVYFILVLAAPALGALLGSALSNRRHGQGT